MHLEAGGAPSRAMCEMLLDPEEGPLMGGYGYKHLNFRDFNRARAQLLSLYNLPLARFAAFLP